MRWKADPVAGAVTGVVVGDGGAVPMGWSFGWSFGWSRWRCSGAQWWCVGSIVSVGSCDCCGCCELTSQSILVVTIELNRLETN